MASALLLSACIPASAPPGVAPPPSPSPPASVQPTAQEPVWRAQSVFANADTVQATRYTVQPGDTLSGIARQTGAGVDAIARANALPPPYLIRPGQTLDIPGGRYHEVRRGETGIAIARAYGVDWSRVVTLNQLDEPYILRVGQRIRLPSEAEVSSMTREQRAAAFDLDIDDIVTGGEPALAENEATTPPVRTAERVLPPDAAVRSPANFAGRFGWPMTGPILSRFGVGGTEGLRNNGIDIAAARGTPVLASAEGVVLYAGDEIQVHGGLVLLSHGDGWITAYAHLEDLQVARGQRIERGQMIARASDTGQVDRPQLHFEIRRNRQPVDPALHLPDLG
ncbi:M23 family metallopeptidase [Parasphingopyxis marina]|uniref:M23 family metallopeptidase n=1 Tax=Parasphingopyxis marina TaxID=2761622 RepID=A0A842I0F6_9SPHN|nr:M23 family metallopeptidase [Parasphingopyxis marina]MBC2778161.1 M23 family metallopeptidase [Parasphingopyxis marina]